MVDINFVWLNSVHDQDFVYYDDTHDWWLLVQTKSPALVHNVPNGAGGKEDVIVPENTALLFSPKMAASYQATGGNQYANYYVRFYTDEDFIQKQDIPLGEPISLIDPDGMDNLFKVLEKEFFYKFPSRQQAMSMLMRLMIMKVADSVVDSTMSEQARALINLRYDIQTRPDHQWTVKEMSNRVHISGGYLQSRYKKMFGVSCMQDVLNFRVDLAKEYLVETIYSSQKISQLCGYQSIEHFCRQFKTITGISPLQYRKQMQAKKGGNAAETEIYETEE